MAAASAPAAGSAVTSWKLSMAAASTSVLLQKAMMSNLFRLAFSTRPAATEHGSTSNPTML